MNLLSVVVAQVAHSQTPTCLSEGPLPQRPDASPVSIPTTPDLATRANYTPEPQPQPKTNMGIRMGQLIERRVAQVSTWPTSSILSEGSLCKRPEADPGSIPRPPDLATYANYAPVPQP